jgi:P-type Cu+ transporter
MSTRSMRRILVLSLALVVLAAFSGLLQAEDTVKCPVNGKSFKKSDAAGKTEYEGKTYYFCCPGHKEMFSKNPEKYLEKRKAAEQAAKAAQEPKPAAAHEHAEKAGHDHAEKAEHEHAAEHEHGEEAGNEKVTDPVCGMKIVSSEAAAKAEYKGKTYSFCMEGCKEKFLENPEKYVKAANEMVACPVMGTRIKKSEAAGSSDYEGKTYYFCCAGCKEKFDKDPAKYAEKK